MVSTYLGLYTVCFSVDPGMHCFSSEYHTCFPFTKGAFHQRRSNLGSAEPGSTLVVDLNQVQVMMRSTNVELRSADVVQLNHDGYTSWTLIGPI